MTEMVRAESGALAVRYELEVEDLIAQVGKIQRLMSQVMKEDEHFGVIPGTGTKPTLLKPGAEKLCLLFRLDPQYHSAETYEGKHLTVKTTVTLWHIPTGQRWGSGEGSCSTKESKYAYRQGKRACPKCGAEAINKSKYPPRGKPKEEPGWYCYAKAGGCGVEFSATDVAITGQVTGRIANEDVADQYNTVLKMSNKRALVAAVLNVTAASDIFTQDIEDMPQAPAQRGEIIDASVLDAKIASVEGVDRHFPETFAVTPSSFDQNIEDRRRLIEQIGVDRKYLGLTDAQWTVMWAKTVGPNVSEQAAPLDKLVALGAHLADKVSDMKREQA